MKKGTRPESTLLTSSLPFLLTGTCFVYIFSEFYLGRNFAITILAATSTFLFILLAITKKQISCPLPQTIIFLVFIGWLLFTSIFSADLTESFWEDIRLISFLLLFLISYNLGLSKDNLKKILKVFALSGGILVSLDLLNFAFSGALGHGIFFSGFLSWHNQMAAFILVLIPLLIVSFINFEKLYLKILSIVLIGTSCIALILTYSRGGWIVFLFQMIALFFFLKTGIRKYFLAFIFCFVAFLSFFIVSTPNLENRLLSIPIEYTSLEYLNESPRLYTWQTGLKIASDFPFFGSGPGTFGQVFANFQSVPWLYSHNAHNHFIEVLTETGIIGFIIFVVLIASLFKNISRETLKKNSYLLAITVSFIGLMMHSVIDYDFSTVSLFSIFWVFAGLTLSQTKNKSRQFYLQGKNALIYSILFLFLILTTFLGISEDAYLLAKYSMDSGNNRIVEDSINRSIFFNPFGGKSYLLASEYYYTQNDSTMSSQMSEKAISLLPYETSHYTILGAIEADKENFKGSEHYYRKAIASRPFSDPNAYTGLAYVLEKQGRLKDAEEILNQAVEERFPLNSTYKGFENAYFISGLTNDLANLYIVLAKLKIANGKEKEAEDLFQIVNNRLTAPKNLRPQ